MSIGANIRKIRKEKDIKQFEMEDKLGVSQSTYSKIENDKYKIEVTLLQKIAEILDVDISKLIGDEKIIITHTNNENSSGGSGIIVHNTLSEKLISNLEERIIELKEQNAELKEQLKTLKEERTLEK